MGIREQFAAQRKVLEEVDRELATYIDLTLEEADKVRAAVDGYLTSHVGQVPNIPGLVHFVRSLRKG